MRSSKVLELINANRIEELKQLLQDEIYEESLKVKPGAKQRYTAMKRYFGYYQSSREVLQKPCEVEFEGKKYVSFCNSYSLAFTTENIGELKLLDDSTRYPDVTRLIRFDGNEQKVDFNKVLADVKSKGYRLNKKEVSAGYKYLIEFDGSYYKAGLLDATLGIINDGKPVMTYKVEGSNKPLAIKNDIGVCMIMPVRYDGKPEDDGLTVIKVD